MQPLFMRHKESLSILLIFVLSVLWWVTVFSNFQTINRDDWDKLLAYHELQRKTIVDYHQFPLWNPYISGGEPWLAHPYSNFLSLYFLVTLFFNTVRGVIVSYLLYAVTGLLGIYFLSRYYGLSRTLSLLNSAFFLNIFNVLTFMGDVTYLTIAFLPWAYLAFHKSKEQKKYLILASLLIGYIFYDGIVYIFITTFIVISADAVLSAIMEKNPRHILSLLAIAFSVIFLTSPKLFPMIELLHSYPRSIILPAFPGFLNMHKIWLGLLELKHFFFAAGNIYTYSPLITEKHIFGYHFSIVVIILLISSFFLLWKKYRTLVIINTILIFLALGDNSPVNLWRLLHLFFSSLKNNLKFFGGVLALFSLTIGLTIKEMQIRFFKRDNLNFLISLAFLFLVGYGAFICAAKIFKEKIPIKYHLGNPKSAFSQTSGDYTKMFEYVYNNKGILNGFDSIGNQIQTAAIPGGNKDYRGEYYFANEAGKIEELFFSPNRLKFDINSEKDDILVINQNYFPGWRSSSGRVVNYNGLIGIALKKGQRQLEVYYLPNSFILGMLTFSIFVVAVFICGLPGLFLYRLTNR
jgi:hypothetical protein